MMPTKGLVLVAGLDLNQRPLGYEPFLSRHRSQRATNNASYIAVLAQVALARLGSRWGAFSWVKSA
jgi:hypothetical protein